MPGIQAGDLEMGLERAPGIAAGPQQRRGPERADAGEMPVPILHLAFEDGAQHRVAPAGGVEIVDHGADEFGRNVGGARRAGSRVLGERQANRRCVLGKVDA